MNSAYVSGRDRQVTGHGGNSCHSETASGTGNSYRVSCKELPFSSKRKTSQWDLEGSSLFAWSGVEASLWVLKPQCPCPCVAGAETTFSVETWWLVPGFRQVKATRLLAFLRSCLFISFPRPQSHSGHAAPTRWLVAAPLHLCPARLSGSSGGPLPSPLLWPRAARLLRYLLHFWSSAVNDRVEGGRACLL